MRIKQQLKILIFAGVFISALISLSPAEETVNFAPKNSAERAGIELIPVTIKGGMESQLPVSLSLDNTEKILNSQVFLNNARRAQKSGVDLTKDFESLYSSGYSGYNFFILFYNFAKAPSCPREYLIQTVRMDKYYYNKEGKQFKFEQEFLVEAIKLNSNKQTKRADEHRKHYALAEAFRRETKVFLEIGCGEIPGIFEGRSWPGHEKKLYHLIENYTYSPNTFNHVHFDDSAKYNFSFMFDRLGNYTYALPDFLLK